MTYTITEADIETLWFRWSSKAHKPERYIEGDYIYYVGDYDSVDRLIILGICHKTNDEIANIAPKTRPPRCNPYARKHKKGWSKK